MKRLFLVLLALCLLFTFTACESSAADNSQAPSQDETSEDTMTPAQAYSLLVAHLTANFDGYYVQEYFDHVEMTDGQNTFHHAKHTETKNGDFNMKLTLAEADGTLYFLVDGNLDAYSHERIFMIFTVPADFEQTGVALYLNKEASFDCWAKAQGATITPTDPATWMSVGVSGPYQPADVEALAAHVCECAMPALDTFMQEIDSELNLSMFGFVLN